MLPVYVLDDETAGPWALGGASRWWLHRSLESLQKKLDGRLLCLKGAADALIPELARTHGAVAVHVNRTVTPSQVRCDARIEAILDRDGVDFVGHAGSALFDPGSVLKPDGTPYRIYTPFYRKACREGIDAPRTPLPASSGPALYETDYASDIDALGLLPAIRWFTSLEQAWTVGEEAALERLDAFLATGIRGYKRERDRPGLSHASRLSPHLRFGEISPNQVWHSVLPLRADSALADDVDTFLAELGWREFSRYLLWHWPSLPEENWQRKFDQFPWRSDDDLLCCWQQGRTGYPIVDAGMRELWQTGYMHNRVRMIVASFLVKNLMLDWRHGERWFWDTLVDADLANNSANWQWVAGSGADAAPFFRIFNPVTQSRKFDADGVYLRRFVPELRKLSSKDIHQPWNVSGTDRQAGNYPEPIVDLVSSRRRALDAFKSLAA